MHSRKNICRTFVNWNKHLLPKMYIKELLQFPMWSFFIQTFFENLLQNYKLQQPKRKTSFHWICLALFALPHIMHLPLHSRICSLHTEHAQQSFAGNYTCTGIYYQCMLFFAWLLPTHLQLSFTLSCNTRRILLIKRTHLIDWLPSCCCCRCWRRRCCLEFSAMRLLWFKLISLLNTSMIHVSLRFLCSIRATSLLLYL